MIKTNFCRYFLITTAVIFMMSAVGYTADEGKIPITTSSEKALKYYIQGPASGTGGS